MNDSSGSETLDLLLPGIRRIFRERNAAEALRETCDLLEREVAHYDWVGFYLADPAEPMLVLGPYRGDATDHVRIPFGTGICGQAAERRETFLVQDVSAESNYLSCSVRVRSEIVVPVLGSRGEVLGEIDIDSHRVSPFTDADRLFLEEVARICAPAVAAAREAIHP